MGQTGDLVSRLGLCTDAQCHLGVTLLYCVWWSAPGLPASTAVGLLWPTLPSLSCQELWDGESQSPVCSQESLLQPLKPPWFFPRELEAALLPLAGFKQQEGGRCSHLAGQQLEPAQPGASSFISSEQLPPAGPWAFQDKSQCFQRAIPVLSIPQYWNPTQHLPQRKEERGMCRNPVLSQIRHCSKTLAPH